MKTYQNIWECYKRLEFSLATSWVKRIIQAMIYEIGLQWEQEYFVENLLKLTCILMYSIKGNNLQIIILQ